MLAHSTFNCISALEKSFAATKTGRGAAAKSSLLQVRMSVARESRATSSLSSPPLAKKTSAAPSAKPPSASSSPPAQPTRQRAKSAAPSTKSPRNIASNKRPPPSVSRRRPSEAGAVAGAGAVKNANPKGVSLPFWPLKSKAPSSSRSPVGTSLDGYEQHENDDERVPSSSSTTASPSSPPPLTSKPSAAAAARGAVTKQVSKKGLGGFSGSSVGASSKAALASHKYLRATLPTRTALNELGNLCYKLLSLTVVGTKKAVPRIMSCDGVDLMIKHKLNTSPAWSPPIREVLAANSAGDNSAKRLKTIFKTDVRLLLNKVR